MKRWERAISLVYLSTALIAILVVPWRIQHQSFGGHVFMTTREYGFLFAPPSQNASIDYGAVLLELMAICILAGTTFLLRTQLEKYGLENFIEKLLSRKYWREEEVEWRGGKTTRLNKMVQNILYFVFLGLVFSLLKFSKLMN